MAASEIIFLPGESLPHTVYLDSCILIAFLDANHQHHVKSSQFVLEAVSAKTEFYLSSLVLDEVWHILMSCWHRQEVTTKFKSNNKHHIAKYVSRIRAATEKILQLFQPILLPKPNQDTANTLSTAMELLTGEFLAPRDSFHLAHAITSSVEGFATIDGGFLPFNNTALTISIVSVAKS